MAITNTYKSYPSKLAGSPANILAPSAGETAIVSKIVLHNVTGGDVDFTISIYDGVASWELYASTLSADETYEITGPLHVEDTQTLRGGASAADSIYYNISYLKIAS